jgi:hypothetical protein
MNIFEKYFNLGDTIQYLNVDFVVLEFTSVSLYPEVNKMVTEYIGGNGKVCQKTFMPAHLLPLVRANGLYVKYVSREKERKEQLDKDSNNT